MRELEALILSNYNLDVKKIEPYMDGYILKTEKGKKYMEKHIVSSKRLEFVHFAKEHLDKNGFYNIDRYIVTKEESPCFVHDGICYTLKDDINGRECDFNSRSDALKAAGQLALLHRASHGFSPPTGCFVQNELERMPALMKKRLREIKRLKKRAENRKGDFDYIYLKYVDKYFDMGQNSLHSLKGKLYDLEVKKTRKEKTFCHHDYSHRNIIFSGNNIIIKGFEHCCIEIKAYDLAELFRKRMEKCCWDFSEGLLLLSEYTDIEALDKETIEAVNLLLEFPYRFWKISNRYYNSKKSWAEKTYVPKLKNVTETIQNHKEFIERFNQRDSAIASLTI